MVGRTSHPKKSPISGPTIAPNSATWRSAIGSSFTDRTRGAKRGLTVIIGALILGRRFLHGVDNDNVEWFLARDQSQAKFVQRFDEGIAGRIIESAERLWWKRDAGVDGRSDRHRVEVFRRDVEREIVNSL